MKSKLLGFEVSPNISNSSVKKEIIKSKYNLQFLLYHFDLELRVVFKKISDNLDKANSSTEFEYISNSLYKGYILTVFVNDKNFNEFGYKFSDIEMNMKSLHDDIMIMYISGIYNIKKMEEDFHTFLYETFTKIGYIIRNLKVEMLFENMENEQNNSKR